MHLHFFDQVVLDIRSTQLLQWYKNEDHSLSPTLCFLKYKFCYYIEIAFFSIIYYIEIAYPYVLIKQ